MILQVALDCRDVAVALETLEAIHPYVGIAEIGTPLMFSAGVAAVREVKKAFPQVQVLADMKLLDGGRPIATIAFEAGADIVTVSGCTNDTTIGGVVAAARDFGGKCFVDLISVQDIESRARAVDRLGADYVGVHTSHDLLGSASAPLDDLRTLKRVLTTAKPAISGGIGPDSVDDIIAVGPEVIIVGSAIMGAPDKAAVAKTLYDKMQSAGK